MRPFLLWYAHRPVSGLVGELFLSLLPASALLMRMPFCDDSCTGEL